MSSPVAEYILLAAKACCAIPNGSTPYENDLTAAGAVRVGEQFLGQERVIVMLPDVNRNPAVRLLKQVDRSLVLYIMGSVAASSDDYETRTIAELRLANDLTRAVATNFYTQLDLLSANLSNTIYSMELNVAQQSGLPERGLGGMLVIFSVAYRVANNTGI